MVDLKFVDLLGTWQHCSYPIDVWDEKTFEDGVGFDGSSIRGWQGIHVSDMLAVPDPDTSAFSALLPLAWSNLRALRPPDRHGSRRIRQQDRSLARPHASARPSITVLHPLYSGSGILIFAGEKTLDADQPI